MANLRVLMFFIRASFFMLLKKLNELYQAEGFQHSIDNAKVVKEIEDKLKPKTHWERSYAQYKCQKIVYRNAGKLIASFPFLALALLAANIFLFVYASKSLFISSPKPSKSTLSLLPNRDLVPDAVGGDVVYNGDDAKKPIFDFSDLRYVCSFSLRYFMHPYFCLKIAFSVFKLSGVAKVYSSVLISNEYSFCSSFVSHYLNSRGVLVMNCMHGEKLVNARDSFCTYDIFFVWDESYCDILKSLNISARFVVSYCPALKIDLEALGGRAVSYFLQGGETVDQINNIYLKMILLQRVLGGESVLFKEHPIYKTPNLDKVVKEKFVYNGDAASLVSDSIAVCGRYTTLLYQVYVSRGGRSYPKIYIDDEFWVPPKEYIMLDKADGVFSTLSEDNFN
ncbi:hypothetical protein [Halomonas sp. PGE1]|uniref:hypothetical protein n=1 Tax=Halomonas sp. PGE1 TaxID=2730360 RepID=UPI001475AD12|nr:hypothetical protein [Halomonas sp. PGE1]QJQ99360.1 hypothetical protein HIR79_12100 [Halomonas sp. PGE1]